MAKVFVVYSSFGEGHKKAALAVGEALGVEPIDFLDFSSHLIKKIYSLSYIIVTKHFPWIWTGLFFSTKIGIFFNLINAIHKVLFFSFLKHIKIHKPEVIIVTHFFPTQLLTSFKKDLSSHVLSVVTDLRAHPLWVSQAVDYYFTALDQTRDDLIALGVRDSRIIKGCVPLRKGFLGKDSAETLCKKIYPESKPLILFVSSLRGEFPLLKETLNTLLLDFNIFVIYGKNKRMKKYLEENKSSSLRYCFFYNKIWDLISASSFLVTKPGGLTIFEGLYKKKLFVFTHYIPGQEKDNMDILLKHGIARFARTKEDFLKALYYFRDENIKLSDNYPINVRDIRKPLRDIINKLSNVQNS